VPPGTSTVAEPAATPLRGRRVLVPRSPAQAEELSTRIRALGGEPVEAPTILIAPGDDDALRAAVRDLADGAFSVVCLTSPNGVAAVAEAVAGEGLDARAFARVRLLAAVGSGTAAALWHHLRLVPDLVPDRATTQALAHAVPEGGGRVLLPRADIASEVLTEVLGQRGYEPVDVIAYRTVAPESLPAEVLEDLEQGRIDLLAFASSSTVRNFVALTEPHQRRGRVVSIGPVTSATCRELGLEPVVEADPHDLDGLVDALVRAAG
jgi:uroporphyrinogen III methyltransferase / synthase